MEKNLVHGPGDKFGQPYRIEPYMREFIWLAYELKADGSRRITRADLGVGKGNAKTELAAAISAAELGGPVVFSHWDDNGRPVGKRRTSPDIPVAAASFDQADLVFGCAAAMIKHGPLADYFEVYETEILVKGGPGRMYRVAAVAGTNDGARPTFFPADELHEWLGSKERVHLVLSNGRAKRADAWELNITTAGWDIGSLLGRKYRHGQRVLAGEIKDDSLLFRWYEPKDKNVDLTDLPALRKALREANPASFVNIEALVQRSREIPEFEFRRYHLNQWVESPEQWLPHGAFAGCADPKRDVEDAAEVVLVLDGQYDGQSTGLIGCAVPQELEGQAERTKPHLFVVQSWEKGERADWKVTIAEAEQAVRDACARYTVLQIGMDPNRWRSSIARLEEEGLPVVAYESHSAARMVPACAQFYDATVEKRVSHDGDDRMAAHVANAVVKVDSRGPRIVKEHRDSERHIDLAVGAVAAFDLATRAAAYADDFRPL